MWRLGAQEPGGWSCWPQTQVAKAPQKPALPATQPWAPPAKLKASGLEQTGDGGSWPESHSPQGPRPEAPNPNKRMTANTYLRH